MKGIFVQMIPTIMTLEILFIVAQESKLLFKIK